MVLSVAGAAAQSTQPLPSPGGTYAVGAAEYHLTDLSRPDSLIPTMESGRTMKVVLWYPAVRGTGNPRTYLTGLEARRSVLGDDFVAGAASVQGTARHAAELARDAAPAPVVLISHSLGGLPGLYAGLGEELASRGYMVAAIGHPGGAGALLLNGEVVPLSPAWDEHDPGEVGIEDALAFRHERSRLWAGDALYVLRLLPELEIGGEEIGGAVDAERVGYIGHSVGGSAAAIGCRASGKLAACVNLDGWPVAEEIRANGLDQPYLHVEESRPYRSAERLEAWGVDREEYDRIQTGLDAGRDSLFQAMSGPSYHLVVDGLPHRGFSDVILWDGPTGEAHALAPGRGLEILRAWIGWFLDRHVRGDVTTRSPDPVRYPEIRFTAYGAEWSQDRPGG